MKEMKIGRNEGYIIRRREKKKGKIREECEVKEKRRNVGRNGK